MSSSYIESDFAPAWEREDSETINIFAPRPAGVSAAEEERRAVRKDVLFAAVRRRFRCERNPVFAPSKALLDRCEARDRLVRA